MIGNDPGRVTAFRIQDPPPSTAAKVLYTNVAAREYKVDKRVTNASNKASEVNAFNMPLTPAMVIKVYPGLKNSPAFPKLVSKPIMLLTGGGNLG